ncbi:MAG: MATE family efflux transporter [Pseudomonadota bacterium]
MTAPADSQPITNRRVLNIALPIVLSNATVPLLGIVDTGVVGQLGEAAPIGAIGIGVTILTFVYWTFGFLRMGTSGMAAQALGAGDEREMNALLIRGYIIAGIIGLAIILLQAPLFWLALQFSPASAEVEALTTDYMRIRVWSAPATIGMYAITGWLVALERTREVLFLQVWMNGLNIILDLWFVLGLDMGVEGVAAANVIAEWSGMAIGVWMCRSVLAGGEWRDRALVFAAEKWRRMTSINTDIMIRSFLIQVGFSFFLLRASAFDDVTLAANQILLQFVFATSHAMDGFTSAAQSLVGQAYGARRHEQVRRGAMLPVTWGVAGASVIGVLFWLGGGFLIDLMTTSEEVRAAGYAYLIWVVLMPPLSSPGWLLDGVFIGATRGRDMRNSMFISLAIYIASAFVLIEAFGNHGLWAGLLVFFIARGVTLGLRYPALEAGAKD